MKEVAAMAEAPFREERFTREQVADRLAFADAALSAAGHQVTDPYLTDLLAKHARGEITGDEARELSRRHILGC